MLGLVVGSVAVVAGLGLLVSMTRKRKEAEKGLGEASGAWDARQSKELVAAARVASRAAIVPIAAGVVAIGMSCVYSQDIGEAIVPRSFGGAIAGHTTEVGFHLKAPWQDALTWDIRNRQVNFFKDSEYKYDGGSYTGSEVTVNDASGTKANIDVQVIYSLDPDKVEELHGVRHPGGVRHQLREQRPSRHGARGCGQVRHHHAAHRPREVHGGHPGVAVRSVGGQRRHRRAGAGPGHPLR